MASVRERPSGSGIWQARTYRGVDPVTRRKRTVAKRLPGRMGIREARRAAQAWEAELRSRSVATEGTLALALEEWHETYADEWSPTTAASYRRWIDGRIGAELGRRRLDELTTMDLERFYRSLIVEGLSPATVRKAHVVISGALRNARRLGWTSTNVAEGARRPAVWRPDLEVPTTADLRDLLEAAYVEDEDWATFLAVVVGAGLRRGEALALRWDRVDLAGGRIHIDLNLVEAGGRLHEKRPKSNQVRDVDVGSYVVAALEKHEARARARARAARRDLDAGGFVFGPPDELGRRPWRPDTVSQRFRRLRNRVGVRARLHDLRHAYGSYLAEHNVPATTIAALMGHQSSRTTVDFYLHSVDRERRRDAAELISAELELEAG